jgi:hypothetical protein
VNVPDHLDIFKIFFNAWFRNFSVLEFLIVRKFIVERPTSTYHKLFIEDLTHSVPFPYKIRLGFTPRAAKK